MNSTFKIEVAEALLPERLAQTRQWLTANVDGVTEMIDRRGFRLQQWEPSGSSSHLKPNELSLEYEARLLPASLMDLAILKDRVYQSENHSVGELLLSGSSRFGSLQVKHYTRASGSQSTDRYYDTESMELTRQMITVRERIKTTGFMTWNVDVDGNPPLNMELPFLVAGSNGMTVRLEFNWIDDVMRSWDQHHNIRTKATELVRNPFFIAKQQYNLPDGKLIPVIEHTTFREKFGFYETLPDGTSSEAFVMNIDSVVAQSLFNHRLASYTDVDISAVKVIDESLFQLLAAFVASFSGAYALQPNVATKAYRDAQLLAMIS